MVSSCQKICLADPGEKLKRVRFGLVDRLTLVPVELAHVFWPTLIAALILILVDGWTASAGAVAAVLSGVVLFPILLPWLPSRLAR